MIVLRGEGSHRGWFARLRAVWLGGLIALCVAAGGVAAGPLPTTLEDFKLPGTQPNMLPNEIRLANECRFCHGGSEAMARWEGSLMAHAARDPLFYACLTIANQDAPGSGELCIRCHAPRAWLAGRSLPPDGSAIEAFDRESVNCMFCHQMVDPINPFNDAPIEDQPILAALGAQVPTSLHTGSYVLDPNDNRRRGPFADATSPHGILASPFFSRSEFCATCHDVSNPVHSLQPDGKYQPNNWDSPAPSFDKRQLFPVERTYSEWLASAFAQGPIDMGGRFGGNKTAVSTCQDCHMPDTTGSACITGGIWRTDLPNHDLNGAATWVLDAIANLYPDEVSVFALQAAKQRNIAMLQSAASMELTQIGRKLRVRVINQTGHKLPTGYPEGRRLWLNARFKNAGEVVISEYGHYDAQTADLQAGNTKVYEAVLGVDPNVAGATGLPVGPTFHFVLNNVILKDNRIPPRGFTNTGFAAVQASPVDYAYADGQHWDDTYYPIPEGCTSAEATLNYQASSKEYIEFLRDANTTDDRGDILHAQWSLTGKSAPVAMTSGSIEIRPTVYGDFDLDGDVDLDDWGFLQACLGGSGVPAVDSCTPADSDGDGDVDQTDFGNFQVELTAVNE